MKNFLSFLAVSCLAVFSLDPTFAIAGGNELVKKRVQDLTTINREDVSASTDFVPVYDASAKMVKKVEARNVAAQPGLVSVGTNTTLTTAHCGRTILLTGAGTQRTVTLPAANGTGCAIKFIVSAVNTSNYIIQRAGSDTLKGGLSFFSDNASNATLEFSTQSATAITLNGTTKGGAGIGDTVDVIDMGSSTWAVGGQVTESGSETTPFS